MLSAGTSDVFCCSLTALFHKEQKKKYRVLSNFSTTVSYVIINDTLARSLEPVVTECKEHTIHTQTQIVASRKPKEIKHTHEGEANFTT